MNVCDCSRPTKNYLCDECDRGMRVMTKRAEWLVLELHTTAARLDVTGGSGNVESKTVSKVAPEAVNYSATLCAAEIQSTLNSLPRRVKLEDIRLHPEAPWYYRTLQHRYARGIKIIDAKPERIHLGACPTPDCGEAMNPVKGEAKHLCRACGVTTYVEAHYKAKIDNAYGVLVRPRSAVALLKAMGLHFTVKAVERWVESGKLEKAGELEGKPAYRYQDVYDVAQRMAARKRTAA